MNPNSTAGMLKTLITDVGEMKSCLGVQSKSISEIRQVLGGSKLGDVGLVEQSIELTKEFAAFQSKQEKLNGETNTQIEAQSDKIKGNMKFILYLITTIVLVSGTVMALINLLT